MVSELNFPSCRCRCHTQHFHLPQVPQLRTQSVSCGSCKTVTNFTLFHMLLNVVFRQLWQSGTESPHPPPNNLVPSQSLSLLCLSSAFSSTVSAVSDLLQNYINCNSLFLAFCFLLSSPSLLFSLSLCYAIIICSMPCKIVGVIVMRGTRQVASWGRVFAGSETSSGFAVAVRVMQMQESCN